MVQKGGSSNPGSKAKNYSDSVYHKKVIDMLKLGCTLPNLADVCLHKSTNYKFYPTCESDKDLCEKN